MATPLSVRLRAGGDQPPHADVAARAARGAHGGQRRPVVAVRATAREHNGLPVDGYAHEAEPWAPEYFGELAQVRHEPDFFLGAVPQDFRGRFINVEGGVRRSYQPEDPELTVWYFGGSTMFGIGQRDDHTIPSVVARLAEEDGVALRSVNVGVSSFVNWQETELLTQMLTRLAPPDLVVFYDGSNDTGLGWERIERGLLEEDGIFRMAVSETDREQLARLPRTPDSELPAPEDRLDLNVELVARQYRRGVSLARRLCASYGVPVLHFWQPQPFAKVPSPADDELWRRVGFDPAMLPAARRVYDEARRAAGVDPIDLSRVLDDVEVPVFFDGSHTNELGARLVAEAMYEHLRPVLVEARAGGGATAARGSTRGGRR